MLRYAKMQTVQVVASLANESAGTSYTVRRLAEALADRGHNSEIMSVQIPGTNHTAKSSIESGRGWFVQSHVLRRDYARWPILRRLGLSSELAHSVKSAVMNGALLHSHGLWLMPNVYAGRAAANSRRSLVVSPHGMLGPAALNFSRHRKRLFWLVAQRRALDAVACFHATAPSEVEDIRAFGLRQPICVVPNGIDLPALPVLSERLAPISPRTVLYLGRLHPIKGLDRLVHAWSQIAPSHKDWQLRIVGPSEAGYVEELQRLASRLNAERVQFEDALFGPDKLTAYREAELFVLPTHKENFAMVVAEALAAGTPVVCTKGAPWRGLLENGCGWWIDQGVAPLAACLADAMTRPRRELQTMGLRGRAWMGQEFSWESVAASMERVYLWSLGLGERPDDLIA